MTVRRDPKKSHRHEGAAKAACTKACRSTSPSDAEEAANDSDTEVVDDDDDGDESDPLVGGVAGALIGGVAGLVIGGVLRGLRPHSEQLPPLYGGMCGWNEAERRGV